MNYFVLFSIMLAAVVILAAVGAALVEARAGRYHCYVTVKQRKTAPAACFNLLN